MLGGGSWEGGKVTCARESVASIDSSLAVMMRSLCAAETESVTRKAWAHMG